MDTARAWLNAIDENVQEILQGERPLEDMLTLNEDRTISWTKDTRWDELLRLKIALPGEDDSAA